MNDPIFRDFLEVQSEEGMALAKASDILELEAERTRPPQRFVARFRCRGLRQLHSREIVEANYFEVGVWLPDDYLAAPEARNVLTLLYPQSVWHPNIAGPFICPGHLTGGTSLVDLLYQVYEILTYQKFSAHDGLNLAACEWARHQQREGRFPIDRRPLKRSFRP